MRKLIIALLLAALPVKADLLPALYDTVTGRLSIPTNITGFTFGGILFTNFTGLGLTNVNGTLRVDTNVIGGGSGGGSGTVTSVGATSTVAGIQFSGTITNAGTLSLTGIVAEASIDPAIARVSAVAAGYQPLDQDLTDIAGIAASNGDLLIRTNGVWARLPHPGSTNWVLRTIGTTSVGWVTNQASSSGPSSPVAASWSGLDVVSDVSLSTSFRLLLTNTSAATLRAPTNAPDGARVLWEFRQDTTGSRLLSLGSGWDTNSPDLGTIVLSTNAGGADFLIGYYNSSSNRWAPIAFMRGYR